MCFEKLREMICLCICISNINATYVSRFCLDFRMKFHFSLNNRIIACSSSHFFLISFYFTTEKCFIFGILLNIKPIVMSFHLSVAICLILYYPLHKFECVYF